MHEINVFADFKPKSLSGPGELLFVIVDYRYLNKYCEGDAYSMPEIQKVGQAKIISLCDLVNIIGSGIRKPDDKKVATVKDMQIPENKKQVRRLIGYCRDYIANFAKIALPRVNES